MKIFNCIIALFILSMINSCDPKVAYVDALIIQNNSKDTIIFTYSTTYPDTSIGYLHSVIGTGILPNTNQTRSIPELNNSNYEHGVIEILLFDWRTVRENSWNDIQSKYLILKRYDLTLDSLKKMNNTIVYP